MRFGRRDPSLRTLVVEITPMIDVVFLLIVFFMTAAQFKRETRVPMQLPQEAGAEQTEEGGAGLVVNLLADGTIVVQNEPLDDAALAAMVEAHLEAAERGGAEAITVRADRTGSTSQLNDLIDRLQRLGVSGVRVGTEVP